MKKLSEILELAMPIYVERINWREKEGISPVGGDMCLRFYDLELKGMITKDEFFKARGAIHEKIEKRNTLAQYLARKGRKTTALAQIRFYKQWIKELKAEGN